MHKILPIVLALVTFYFGFYIAKNTLSRIYSDLGNRGGKIIETPIPTGGCDANCQNLIIANAKQNVLF